MGKSKFTKSEWTRINSFASMAAEAYGLPQRREHSVVLGTFNICELGNVGNRSKQAWAEGSAFLWLEHFYREKEFDLIVMDSVAVLRALHCLASLR